MSKKLVIADSGSTKTHWAIGSPEGGYWEWKKVSTEGLNPRQTSKERFDKVLREVKQEIGVESEVARVWFYGAGCGTEEMKERVKREVREMLESEEVEVEGDLMGACRAVRGEESGLVAIVGTGSNACMYDGKEIVRQVVSTGYVLGDEGSGNHIGRVLLKEYLVGRMPKELATEFEKEYPGSVDERLQKLYKGETPNRYLAEFAKFAAKRREEEYVKKVLSRVFEAFWKEQIEPIAEGESEVRMVGSVAETFKEEIRKAAPKGMRVGSVEKEPIEGLKRWIERRCVKNELI